MNMDTASIQFVLYGLLAAVISNLNPSRAWRTAVLFGTSIVFLCLLSHNVTSFLPLIGFLLLGYLGLVVLRHGGSKYLAWSIILTIAVYVWLKKYTFLPGAMLLHSAYFTLGLSYIFFRVLHLLIEAGESENAPPIGPYAYLLYTLNFTTLVSGPIERYDEFARDQFAEKPIALGQRLVGLQLERIIRGFFKVNVLAMLLHALQQDALAQMNPLFPVSLRVISAFKLSILYPFFLYANFSGYIDMVIAIARLMRVQLPENFDRPFSASSFIDFWSRWHITLSLWLKTYVYNPLLLTLMRRISSVSLEPLLGVFSFFVTFFLVGIWHGRTSEFVLFGVLQGGGVAINKIWQLWMANRLGRKGYKSLAKNSVYIAFGRGLTFSWFAFTLFWFWGSWNQIDTLFETLGAGLWFCIWVCIWLSATLVLALWEKLRAGLLSIRTEEGPVLISRYARVAYATALAVTALVVTILLNQPAPDIVYKAF